MIEIEGFNYEHRGSSIQKQSVNCWIFQECTHSVWHRCDGGARDVAAANAQR